MKNFPETLNWDDVRFFLELGRQGKLTAAARALGVEHATVARRVGSLEQGLGVRLFDRLPKSWKLTSEGEELLAHARRIEEHTLAFSRAGMGVGTLSGPVRISAPPIFASHFLVPRMGALRGRWPGIHLELIGEVRVANLYRREADIALRMLRPEEPGLAARLLGQIGYGLYAAACWTARPREEWEFIGYDDSMRCTPQQQWLDKLAAGRPLVLRSNDMGTLYHACRSGYGFALLPHFLARGDPDLVPYPGHTCALRREVWMVIHPDVRRSPRVKAVADGLAELFEQDGQALA